jgi:hypothetical protein
VDLTPPSGLTVDSVGPDDGGMGGGVGITVVGAGGFGGGVVVAGFLGGQPISPATNTSASSSTKNFFM